MNEVHDIILNIMIFNRRELTNGNLRLESQWKKDRQDDFLEYKIYKDHEKRVKNNFANYYNSSNGSMSTTGAVFIAVIILAVVGCIISYFEPKCAQSGCDNEPMEGSQYCSIHNMKYRYGEDYYDEYGE